MKKGFTLIEMIGVMVILSVLLIFVMPSVINYIKSGGDAKDKVVEEMIFEATKDYMSDNKNMFKEDEKNTYCISLNTLAIDGYVESPIKLSSSDNDITASTSTKTVKVTYDKKYKFELTDECTGIVNPTPVLYKGLTPVMYDEENETWVVADIKEDNWYNYDEQMWANAVVLGNDLTKKPGDTVAVDGTEAKMMLVWIPRYEYKYTNLGENYAGGTQEQPGEIKINFVLKNTTTPSSDDYKIHPAFTFGEEELSGFWVGKFELSHSTKTNNRVQCVDENCDEAEYLRVLPNKASLTNNSVSNFWYGIKSIESTVSFGLANVDIHMIKNSEWGAVAYLSQSKYGKYENIDYTGINKEVYQNKSSSFITGLSNGTPSQSSTNMQCEYNDMTNLGDGKGVCGPGASTTGNVYGVYDMSGGTSEYIMGVYGTNTPEIGLSGFAITTFTNGVINPKYYDMYTINETTMVCTNRNVNVSCYGHGLSETKNWWNDKFNLIDSTKPWIARGAIATNSMDAGIYALSRYEGVSDDGISTRIVFVFK